MDLAEQQPLHARTKELWDNVAGRNKDGSDYSWSRVIEPFWKEAKSVIHPLYQLCRSSATTGDNILHLSARRRDDQVFNFFAALAPPASIVRNKAGKLPWQCASSPELGDKYRTQVDAYLDASGRRVAVEALLDRALRGEWERVEAALVLPPPGDTAVYPADANALHVGTNTTSSGQLTAIGASLFGIALMAEIAGASAVAPTPGVPAPVPNPAALSRVLATCRSRGASLTARDLVSMLDRASAKETGKDMTRRFLDEFFSAALPALPGVDVMTVPREEATLWMLIAAAVHDVNALVAFGRIAANPSATTSSSPTAALDPTGWNVLTLILSGHGEAQRPEVKDHLRRERWRIGPAFFPDDPTALADFIATKLSSCPQAELGRLLSLRDPITKSTPLLLASRLLLWDVVRALIAAGAPVDELENNYCRMGLGFTLDRPNLAPPANPRTALEIAVHEIMRLTCARSPIVAAPVLPYVADDAGAGRAGLMTVSVLLNAKADPGRLAAGEWSAFISAIRTGLPVLVALFGLSNVPQRLSGQFLTALHHAIVELALATERSLSLPAFAGLENDKYAKDPASLNAELTYRSVPSRFPPLLVLQLLLGPWRRAGFMDEALMQGCFLATAAELNCVEAFRLLRRAGANEGGKFSTTGSDHDLISLFYGVRKGQREAEAKVERLQTKYAKEPARLARKADLVRRFTIRCARFKVMELELEAKADRELPTSAIVDEQDLGSSLSSLGEEMAELINGLRSEFEAQRGMARRGVTRNISRHDAWWRISPSPDTLRFGFGADALLSLAAWAKKLGVKLYAGSSGSNRAIVEALRTRVCFHCGESVDAVSESHAFLRPCSMCAFAHFCSEKCESAAKGDHVKACKPVAEIQHEAFLILDGTWETRRTADEERLRDETERARKAAVEAAAAAIADEKRRAEARAKEIADRHAREAAKAAAAVAKEEEERRKRLDAEQALIEAQELRKLEKEAAKVEKRRKAQEMEAAAAEKAAASARKVEEERVAQAKRAEAAVREIAARNAEAAAREKERDRLEEQRKLARIAAEPKIGARILTGAVLERGGKTLQPLPSLPLAAPAPAAAAAADKWAAAPLFAAVAAAAPAPFVPSSAHSRTVVDAELAAAKARGVAARSTIGGVFKDDLASVFETSSDYDAKAHADWRKRGVGVGGVLTAEGQAAVGKETPGEVSKPGSASAQPRADWDAERARAEFQRREAGGGGGRAGAHNVAPPPAPAPVVFSGEALQALLMQPAAPAPAPAPAPRAAARPRVQFAGEPEVRSIAQQRPAPPTQGLNPEDDD